MAAPATVNIPANAPHQFRNASGKTAHMLLDSRDQEPPRISKDGQAAKGKIAKELSPKDRTEIGGPRVMKLYWGPHTCAIGIHILLEEIGAPYETERLDVGGGSTRETPFLAVNPKGKVPTLLRDDGSVLTEFGAIATWLARTCPDRGLIPEEPEGEARMVETMDYVEGTIHGQGYGRLFAPEQFAPQNIVHRATGLGAGSVKAQGIEFVEKDFAILDSQLARHDFAVGDRLSLADAALFYVERWAPAQGITLPINLQRHFERMCARPAVHKVRQLWDDV